MQAKYYKMQFHNIRDGIFYTGSSWDEYNNKSFTFVYSSAFIKKSIELDKFNCNYKIENNIDLFVLGNMNIVHINQLLDIMDKFEIKTIVYPYLSPIQRLILSNEAVVDGESNARLQNLLKDPYRYFKRRGIECVFPLLGNSDGYPNHIKANEIYFEPLNDREMKYVEELEGYKKPVVKAGYIIANDWIFYFGNYEMNIKAYREFTYRQLHCFKQFDDCYTNKIDNDSIKLKQLTAAAHKEFNLNKSSTVVMYHGPANDNPAVEDCVLNVHTFQNHMSCSPVVNSENSICALRCASKNDIDVCKKHKNKEGTDYILGTMLLGCVDLNAHLREIENRFRVYNKKIRFLTVPNSGSREHWNSRILELGATNHRKYWVCGTNHVADNEVIKDICLSSPYNRYITTSEDYGLCINGFLKHY